MTAPTDILLPVETSNRELDAKLLLGLFAAEAGFRCHIGAMNRIRSPGFAPSIYISKSVCFTKAVKQMADFGHTVVAWDEEDLARFNDTVHSARIEPAALRLPRLLLAWGHNNAELWRRHPFYDGGTIIETGNPRIDLLREELRPMHRQRADELRQRYGNFVLLNTNFAMVNHFRPGGRRKLVGTQSQDADAYMAFRRGVEAHKLKLFDAFRVALPVIAESISPHRLVVRPHPSEDQTPWFKAAEGVDNITVIHDGAAVPWQLAARCQIHNGCTTAVEASVLRLPALAYRPVENAAYDLALPNALSENFSDLDSLCARTEEYVTGRRKLSEDAPYGAILRDNVAALEGPLACERIVVALQGMRQLKSGSPVSVSDRMAALGKYALKMTRLAILPALRRYEEHKSRTGDFTLDDIRRRAELMGKALGRFQTVSCAARSPGVVTLSNRHLPASKSI